MNHFYPKSPVGAQGAGERGAVLVLVTLLLPVLIGFMALAIDVGYLYSVKRKLQTVADAAALACAHQMQRASQRINQTLPE